MSQVITITIEDGYENRVLDSFADAFSWTHPDGYGSDGYYSEKADFLQDELITYIEVCVKQSEMVSTQIQAKADLIDAEEALTNAQQISANVPQDYVLDPLDIT